MAIFKKENGQLVDFSNPIPDTSIAPIENGATSTHNYVVGAYALVKGILKKVTNAISIGTAFSDSNSETTDVATELKELNDDVTTINTHLNGMLHLKSVNVILSQSGELTINNKRISNTSECINCFATTGVLVYLIKGGNGYWTLYAPNGDLVTGVSTKLYYVGDLIMEN
jgi:hypothetical protein